MLAKLKLLFQTELADTVASEDELRLACAALMIEVATIDNNFDQTEFIALQKALRSQFLLSEDECNELTALAEQERHDAVSLHQFTRLVNERSTPKQKFDLITAMWRVAFADGSIDKYEEHLIRRAADLLYVSHSDFIRAKITAKN